MSIWNPRRVKHDKALVVKEIIVPEGETKMVVVIEYDESGTFKKSSKNKKNTFDNRLYILGYV